MKRYVADILRENKLTYMRNGKELYNYIEEKDGMRYMHRLEVPLALQIEEGYEYLGTRMLADLDGNITNGFIRPKGKAVGMTLCDVMFDSDGRCLFKDINEHIEEMKQKVYISILLSVCKHYIKTDNKIQICVEYLGNHYFVRGWLMVD